MLERTPVLESIGPSLWCVTAEQRIPLGAVLPNRMTVVRLSDGSLALWCVIPIDDVLAGELGALGAVRHLVAPNRFHHLHLRAARLRYPDARLYAAPGLEEKVPGLHVDETLGDQAPAAFRADLETALVAGAPMSSEVVSFHRASKTLIVSDLVFHVKHPSNAMSKMMLVIAGTSGGRFAQSRLFRAVIRDRAAYRVSIEVIGAWPFERIVMSHGQIVESSNAATMLLEAAL